MKIDYNNPAIPNQSFVEGINMELSHYIRILRRWWWLPIIVAVLTGGAAYVFRSSEEPIYQASVKIFTGSVLDNPNPSGGEIQTGNQLAQTYASIVTTRPILESTIEALDLTISSGSLAGHVQTSILENTSLLTLIVQDTNPVRAADIANELAAQLIDNSPTNLTPEQESLRSRIETEVAALSDQIDRTREELDTITTQLEEETVTPEDQITFEARQDNLLEKISRWQQSIADLTNSLNSLDIQTNRLTVVEPAITPQNPIGSSSTFVALQSFLVGLALGIGLVLLLDYLDDTIRSAEDIVEATGELPILGGIIQIKSKKGQEPGIAVESKDTGVTEGYRNLRTNLIYGFEEEKLKQIVVTSARAAEGKSTTAANLAVSLAKSELRTVLIDADMHRPKVHKIFELDNKIGLSNLFTGAANTEGMSIDQVTNQLLQPTDWPRLNVITSGPLPPNPAELYGLPHINNLCRSLKDDFGVDMIIFDTPPVLAVVDSIALASSTRSSVLMVILPGTTHRRDIARVLGQFDRVGVDVLGSVMNRVKSDSSDYYYYYSGYGYYARTQEKKA